MDLSDIHLATVIAREGGLSAAAARLGVAPGTLSKAVTRLERETKVRLFERWARGMRPTELGRVFFQRAERIHREADDLYAELRDLRQARAGVLRCGVGDGIPDRWVLPVVAELAERGVALDLTGGNTDTLQRAVAAGDLEFALTGLHRNPHDGLAWESVRDDPILPAAPVGHPLAEARQGVSWQRLGQARWIVMAQGTLTRAEFEANFLAQGIKPPVPLVTTRSSQRELALMHTLAALMPLPLSVLEDPGVAQRVVPVALAGEWPSARRLGIVTRAQGYLSPAAVQAIERFTALLRPGGRAP